MESKSNSAMVFAPLAIIEELKAIELLVDPDNERAEVVHPVPESTARVRAVAKDGRNMYEIERDEYHEIESLVLESALKVVIGVDAMWIVLDCLAPYAYTEQPYMPEILAWRATMSEVRRSDIRDMPPLVLEIVSAFLEARILLSEPIPCAITTIGKVNDFDYDQAALIAAIQERGALGLVNPKILAVANTKGIWIQPGIIDPRTKTKSKHGRPSKPSGYQLFGTSQTTFWVKTKFRADTKVFCVKAFQKHVSLETLGGLWADCRDTKDVNNTVLNEMKASLGAPDIAISHFSASMRNYRFKLLTGQNIHLLRLYDVFAEMRATTHPYIFAQLDVAKYPALILEIDVENHTSKRKRLAIKVFSSGKLNLDSCVYQEHVTRWYKFVHSIFVDHPGVLYYPALEEEYDSDYHYKKAGVTPPPQELVDC
jgi:hypothetical protein